LIIVIVNSYIVGQAQVTREYLRSIRQGKAYFGTSSFIGVPDAPTVGNTYTFGS